MNDPTHYDFRIDAWKPDTLPMARLAEYLAKLAMFIGFREDVHFIQVRKGSAVPEFIVDYETAPKVAERLRLVSSSNAPMEAIKAQQEINRMLREDNASASLRVKKGAEIICFPGCKTPLAERTVSAYFIFWINLQNRSIRCSCSDGMRPAFGRSLNLERKAQYWQDQIQV